MSSVADQSSASGCGHFEVWAEDGEIVFRHALVLHGGERPTLAQAAAR